MNLKMAQLINSDAENLYELLGVNPSASIEEVRESYERKLEEVHEESLASYSLCPDEENEQRLRKESERIKHMQLTTQACTKILNACVFCTDQ